MIVFIFDTKSIRILILFFFFFTFQDRHIAYALFKFLLCTNIRSCKYDIPNPNVKPFIKMCHKPFLNDLDFGLLRFSPLDGSAFCHRGSKL